jgi:hypothetical protein
MDLKAKCDELTAAVEAYNATPKAAPVGAFDFGLITVILPILLQMVVSDSGLRDAILAIVNKLIETFNK